MCSVAIFRETRVMKISLRHHPAQLLFGSRRNSPLEAGWEEPGLIVSTGSCPSLLSSGLFPIPLRVEVRVLGPLVSLAGESPASP